MNWLKKYAKRIGFDVAGYSLIILSIALGWLPGPGGIPLFLGGLALLAVHNHWAKKLLIFAKTNGDKLVYVLFPKNKLIEAIHDIVSIILILSGAYLLIHHVNYLYIGFGVALVAIGIAEFCFNRYRLQTWRNKR